MSTFGLIGGQLKHSFSKQLFEERFVQETHKYLLFELNNLEDLKSIIISNHLMGFNVTIPFKTTILPYLNEFDETAREIGAVNCVKVQWNKNNFRLKGYNTDALAFEQSLTMWVQDKIDNALILGNGGASKAVQYVLLKNGIKFDIVSTQEKFLVYSNLRQTMQNYQLIVNTTPLGMYPNIKEYPDIPFDELNSKHWIYDLIYNPQETMFLKIAKNQKSHIKNGLKMLSLQANFSWKIWNLI
ncbi:MAG: shikimate dehydrogenase [Bacteroidales bacterium]|nr:shikimate dehydrogenase [Bacteroidales bacterium]